MASIIHIINQIFKQTMVRRGRLNANHRGLVDDEERVCVAVDGAYRAQGSRGIGGRHIDFLVDGESRPVRIATKHFGGTARRRQQHTVDT